MDTSTISLALTEANVRNTVTEVILDLDNDGVYETDITSDATVDYIDTILELKQKGEVLGKPASNNALVSLVNNTGRYSPNNPNNIESEVVGGQFRRNTKIRILGGFVDQGVEKKRILFTGIIQDFKSSIQNGNKKVTLKLVDMTKFAKRKKNPNHNLVNGIMYEGLLLNSTLSESVDYLIQYCYGNITRDILPLVTVYPIIEFPKDQYVWQTIQKIAEACGAKAYFDNSGQFCFYSPLNSAAYQILFPSSSVYTFLGSNIFDFIENTDEDSIVNKWKITSNGKTIQPRQIVVGSSSTNILTITDEYKNGDGKNALDVTNKIITLKCQEGISWINTINMPLVDCQTYSDLISPTQEMVDAMNAASIVKVWNKLTGVQLTIQNLLVGNSSTPAQIILKDALNPADYNIQITYQYYNDRICYGKYKWYTYEFLVATEIEYPSIESHDGYELTSYSTDDPVNKFYLSDWEIFDGNTKVKFKLTNNVPIRVLGAETLDTVYISRFEIFANPLLCINSLVIEAIDSSTISEFENAYEIENSYITDPQFAKQVCDYFLWRYSKEKSFLTANVKGMPQIDILDRVSVIETSVSGISFDFVVVGIKHIPAKNGQNWKTVLELESLVSAWNYDATRVEIQEPQYIPRISMTLPEIPITSNNAVQAVYSNNLLYASVTLNFTSPAYFNVIDFLEGIVVRQETVNGRYIYCTSFADPYTTSITIANLQYDQDYTFYVLAVDKYNNRSIYGTGYSVNIPAFTGLPNVNNLSMFYENGILPTLTWSIIEGIPNVLYEVRLGSSWETATFLGRTNVNKFTCIGSGTYWVSGYYNGYYSTTPTSFLDVTGIVSRNIIATYDEKDTYWTGSKSSGVTVDYNNVLCLAGTGNFDDIPDLDAVPDLDAYGGVPSYGTYEIPASHIIDITTPQTCIVGGNFNLISNSSTTGAKIQIALSIDGTTYGDWKDLIPSQYYARKFKFRLYMTSTSNVVCKVNSFSFYVDVPDVVDGGKNVVVSVAGTAISFSKKYNAVPGILISILEMQSGDYFRLSNEATTGFIINLYNSSNVAISKNINWISQGY
jgi:hypothetical protein